MLDICMLITSLSTIPKTWTTVYHTGTATTTDLIMPDTTVDANEKDERLVSSIRFGYQKRESKVLLLVCRQIHSEVTNMFHKTAVIYINNADDLHPDHDAQISGPTTGLESMRRGYRITMGTLQRK
ncbi:hypothetical protein BT63DRAFT_311276 [Microthyrium microscopicum]|uniref:Uncharacterized protein n=1 Tax=Microthyrium microscopicum TaxID=703497 RepID=A0A6A6U4N8_9PEZI|nr:hypothetical protein BT63DRAFT_311276 [Microthyrium microscopicum]